MVDASGSVDAAGVAAACDEAAELVRMARERRTIERHMARAHRLAVALAARDGLPLSRYAATLRRVSLRVAIEGHLAALRALGVSYDPHAAVACG